MGNLSGIVDSLESKVVKLLQEYENLKRLKTKLEDEITILKYCSNLSSENHPKEDLVKNTQGQHLSYAKGSFTPLSVNASNLS